MSSEVKLWWSSEKIKWYERASSTTSFQEELASLLSSHIALDESITELGTGLGYQGELLKKLGYDITSYDIDEEVIKRARARSSLDIFRAADYRSIKEQRDVVLAVFFGRITEDDNLDYLLSLAKKRLIYLQSCHRGQSSSLRKKGDNTERTISYLESRGIRFKFEECKIPFPQKLESEKEAEEFIKSSYGEDKVEDYIKFVTKSDDKRFPLEFKNDKEFIIFVIEKE